MSRTPPLNFAGLRPGWIRSSTLLVLTVGILAACRSQPPGSGPSPRTAREKAAHLTAAEVAALRSLVQIDGYPLYTMVMQGARPPSPSGQVLVPPAPGDPAWACALFAAGGTPSRPLLGRNFDWEFSPGLLLFTDSPDAYASVSMVDLTCLGFVGKRAHGLTDRPIEERIELLKAGAIPFDGLNEAGLAVAMARVPPGRMKPDPARPTVDAVMIIRKILDKAATIDEAVEIIRRHNIDMLGHYLHYLIAEKSGRSVLVEFSRGEMVVIPNRQPWLVATNFLLSETERPGASCGRYESIRAALAEAEGKIGSDGALRLLAGASQPTTQWSAVYDLVAGKVRVAMGRRFDRAHERSIAKMCPAGPGPESGVLVTE